MGELTDCGGRRVHGSIVAPQGAYMVGTTGVLGWKNNGEGRMATLVGAPGEKLQDIRGVLSLAWANGGSRELSRHQNHVIRSFREARGGLRVLVEISWMQKTGLRKPRKPSASAPCILYTADP